MGSGKGSIEYWVAVIKPGTILFELKKIKEINKEVKSQAVLTKEVVDELAKVDPAIRQIVNEQDTALSLWQKTRIQVKGYTGDLKALTAAQTNDLYNLQITLGKAVEAANRAKGGALEKQYSKLDKDKERQKAYEKAAKGQKVADQISDREKMSALQKQIDLNNKLADSRIKALTAAKFFLVNNSASELFIPLFGDVSPDFDPEWLLKYFKTIFINK